MLKPDKKLSDHSPMQNYGKAALAEYLYLGFLAVSVVVTAIIAWNMQSWWPFAGWFVLSVAVAWKAFS